MGRRKRREERGKKKEERGKREEGRGGKKELKEDGQRLPVLLDRAGEAGH